MAVRSHLHVPTPLLALLLAAGSVLAHAAWLGWDDTYQVDPVTGRLSGPYEAWQVVGCVLTLVVLAVAAGVLHHPLLAFVVVPLVFTVTWSVTAVAGDDSGLWAVGALMVLAGTAGGTAALAYTADAFRGCRP